MKKLAILALSIYFWLVAQRRKGHSDGITENGILIMPRKPVNKPNGVITIQMAEVIHIPHRKIAATLV